LDVLLLDEPTAALDPKSAETVINLAFKVVREKELTAILVTHDLRHCLYPVDRVIQMQEGEIRKDITGRQLEVLELDTLKNWF
jgi:putative ABC transport system ATP-binding protein